MNNVNVIREAWLNQDRSNEIMTISCRHCGKSINEHSHIDDFYCSDKCWHLSHLGDFKAHIKRLLLTKCGTQTFLEMQRWGWFDGVSDSSVGRYRSLLFGLDRRLTNGNKISEFGELMTG